MKFVLDASVALSWAFEDKLDLYSESVLFALEKAEALVPSVWPLVVGEGLLMAEQKRKITRAEAIHFLNMLWELPISVEIEVSERIFSEIFFFAQEYKIRTYQAAHLHLAARTGLPLATQDKSLRTAAAKSGVPIFFAPY